MKPRTTGQRRRYSSASFSAYQTAWATKFPNAHWSALAFYGAKVATMKKRRSSTIWYRKAPAVWLSQMTTRNWPTCSCFYLRLQQLLYPNLKNSKSMPYSGNAPSKRWLIWKIKANCKDLLVKCTDFKQFLQSISSLHALLKANAIGFSKDMRLEEGWRRTFWMKRRWWNWVIENLHFIYNLIR